MFSLSLSGLMLMSLGQFFSIIFPAISAVNPDCNYYQNMDVGATYYVYNRQYPNYYGRDENCLWVAVAPAGYVVEAVCNLELPQSPGCTTDRVLISLTGNAKLEMAEVYCGKGNLTVTSVYNNISIGLQSAYNSIGGRFLCTLKAKQSVPTSCDCGWRNMRRIVGGTETRVNEYPMMAALIQLDIRELICGATIIARRYAATAAHCLTKKTPNMIALLIGEHNVSTGTDTNATRLLLLELFINHPDYNPSDTRGYNDIAIVKTQTNIEFNSAVGPACLPFRYYGDSFAEDIVTALGWGTTEFTGPKSDVLLKTDLKVLDYNTCYQSVNGTINQMCTYYPGHDACQSDSGGPLMWQSSSRLHLVGVISLGFGCASSKPALNTRVTQYLMWILSVTPGADYCVKD